MIRIDKRLAALEASLSVDAPPSIFVECTDEELKSFAIGGQPVGEAEYYRQKALVRPQDCVIRIEYVKDWRAV